MPEDLTDDRSTSIQVMAVPKDNKPLPGSMFSIISWYHMVSLGHNELNS